MRDKKNEKLRPANRRLSRICLLTSRVCTRPLFAKVMYVIWRRSFADATALPNSSRSITKEKESRIIWRRRIERWRNKKLIRINGECSRVRFSYHNHRPTWKFFLNREYTFSSTLLSLFVFLHRFRDHNFGILLQERHGLIVKWFHLWKKIRSSWPKINWFTKEKPFTKLQPCDTNDYSIFDGSKICMQNTVKLFFFIKFANRKNKYNYIILKLKFTP